MMSSVSFEQRDSRSKMLESSGPTVKPSSTTLMATRSNYINSERHRLDGALDRPGPGAPIKGRSQPTRTDSLWPSDGEAAFGRGHPITSIYNPIFMQDRRARNGPFAVPRNRVSYAAR